MISHAHAIDLSQDQPPLPNLHFSSWLRGQTTLFVGQIIAVLGIILFFAEEVYYVWHGPEYGKLLEPMTAKLIVDYAHIVFIAVFILVLIRVLDDNDRGSYRVKLVYERVFKKPKKGEESVDKALESSQEQLKTFKRRFLWFWVGMLCLYVSFACQHTYEASFEPAKEPAGKEVSLSLAGSSHGEEGEFKGKLSLNIADEAHRAPSENSPSIPKKSDQEKLPTKLVFSSLAFFFNNFTLLFVFSCFLVMYIRPDEVKKKERKYLVGAVVAVGFLVILFFSFLILNWGKFTPKSAGNYVAIFDALSGVINAVVLALLIARLDSKLVGLPSWLISILYSYAAVQPLFLVFEVSDSELLKTITTLVLIFVFISKIYFFLIIFYALQTGKMLNYLTCFPILRKRAEEPVGNADTRSSALKRVMMFGFSVLRPNAKRLGKRPQKHVAASVRSLRSYPTEISTRVCMSASRALRNRRSLDVSELLGGLTILYFFISMIGSQVISGTDALAAAGVGSVAVYMSPNVPKPPATFDVIVGVAQLFFVLLMMATLFLVARFNGCCQPLAAATGQAIFDEPLNYGDLIQKGKKQLEKFKRYFLYFWYMTFLLYMVFLSRLFFLPQQVCSYFTPKSIECMVALLFYPTLEFLLSSLNLMCAFWCFIALQSPTFSKPYGVTRERSDMLRKHFEAKQKRFEARQKMLVNYSSFVILLFIAIFPLLLLGIGGSELSENQLIDYVTVFDGVTGLLSAIVLALLIARMDSKLFSLPSRLIWMLFTYASIQSLFIAFAQNLPVLQMVRTSVLTTALGLKICFFLIVAHSLQSGRMLNYLVCFPLLKERVDSIFENQFEIRLARAEDDKFTFSILKKNRLLYSAAKTFKSREKCDKAIKKLRELMKESGPYGAPQHSSGTYWVEVKLGDKLLCESIPLRSADEALDLIDDSMSKVPYCKYNRL
jgi:hypothetical protein